MPSGRPLRAAGFAYLLLLVGVAALALAASTSLQLGSTLSRRAAERELLAIGADFQRALRSYAHLPDGAARAPSAAHAAQAAAGTTGAHNPRGPDTLEALLRDPRVAGVRRHLRHIPADPLTGSPDWGLVRDAAGTITGVYSLAPGRPIQREGFEPGQLGFENAQGYGDWVFGIGGAVVAGGAVRQAPESGR